MKVVKQTGVGAAAPLNETELDLINSLAQKTLTAEEVYPFSVKLCDNEIDRDGERFSPQTLGQLAELFVGKSGIFDHQWSAMGQAARIYRTELIREERTETGAGDGYCYVKGYAYMVRTEGNRDLITEIEAGIKKEVSVGCSVARAVCSICGEDRNDRIKCSHVKGKQYGGKLCFTQLEDATDAYEWSFVAVPAQKQAGVMKRKRMEEKKGMDLRKRLEEEPESLAALDKLEREAALGRSYLKSLQDEVARLGAIVEPELACGVLQGITEKLEERELKQLKKTWEKRAGERYPLHTQLTYCEKMTAGTQPDVAFLI